MASQHLIWFVQDKKVRRTQLLVLAVVFFLCRACQWKWSCFGWVERPDQSMVPTVVILFFHSGSNVLTFVKSRGDCGTQSSLAVHFTLFCHAIEVSRWSSGSSVAIFIELPSVWISGCCAVAETNSLDLRQHTCFPPTTRPLRITLAANTDRLQCRNKEWRKQD